MSAWIIWLIAAIVLLLLEVLTQAVWSLCFAIGCLVAMLTSLYVDSTAIQGIVLGIAAIISWILFAPAIRKWEKRRAHSSKTGMDALIGRTAIVTEEIKPGATGRARIDGDYWQAIAPEATESILPGENVIVTGHESIVLYVTHKNTQPK